MNRQMQPHVPYTAVKWKAGDWMGRAKNEAGCEINFNRDFYKYTPPRPLEEIDVDLQKAEEEILRLLREVVE